MRTPSQQLRRLKRRKPGVYLYRTWRHLQPTKREWGYGGKANDLDVRAKCHLGTCHHQSCRKAGPKPWSDLIVRRYALQFPWWLGFEWITLFVETLMIWVFRPRYNDRKNPRLTKVRKVEQLRQRAERDAGPASYVAKVRRFRITDLALKILGAVAILSGLVGWWVTR